MLLSHYNPRMGAADAPRRTDAMPRTANLGDASKPKAAFGEPKLAHKLALRIEAEIMRTSWPVGEVFTNQVELAERHKVSVSVVREAIRVLEQSGLLRTRRGRGGGLEVSAPMQEEVIAALRSYLALADISPDDVFAVRSLLEMQLLNELGRTGESKSAELRALLADAHWDSPVRGLTLAYRLYVKATDVVDNPVLGVFAQVLMLLGLDLIFQRQLPESRLIDDGARLATLRKRQMQAALAGDLALATDLGERSLAIVRDWHEWTGSGAHGRTAYSDEDPSGILTLIAEIRGPKSNSKLAEVVAQKMEADIQRRGLQVGDHLGTEVELLKAYGVSRGVLREAIRSLERHNIVRMARGKHGGLRVASPNPSTLMHSAELHFRFKRVSPAQVGVVSRPLQREGVELAAARVRSGDKAAKAAAVGLLRKFKRTATPSVQLNAFHAGLGELSGQPVLRFFLDTLASLAGPGAAAGGPAAHLLPGDPSACLQRVLESILSGDPKRARMELAELHLQAH